MHGPESIEQLATPARQLSFRPIVARWPGFLKCPVRVARRSVRWLAQQREHSVKDKTFLNAIAVLVVLAGAAVTAMASYHDKGTATVVSNVSASIEAYNYDEDGEVNGFMDSTGAILTFNKPVCGGVGSLGAPGNSITYSGILETFVLPPNEVDVSTFSNIITGATYPPPAIPKPRPYPSTTGTVLQLNYDVETGTINGFAFSTTSGTVLVDVGQPSPALAAALSGALKGSATVVGTLEAPPRCAPVGTVSGEVDASSVNLSGMQYVIRDNR